MDSKVKRIGITLRIVEAQNYDEQRDALSHDWIPFLHKLNAIPLLIPNSLENVEAFLDEMSVNGIILSGGDNIGDHKQRDKTEKDIINYGISKKIPIFGVCRGMQVLNNFFGGMVDEAKTKEHVSKPHQINIISKPLQSNLGINSFQVNSFHNNIILEKHLGKDLKLIALCPKDNTIEGFVHENFPIMGVMWHPERSNDSINEKILQGFFKGQIS